MLHFKRTRVLAAFILSFFLILGVGATYFGHSQDFSTLFGLGPALFTDILLLSVLIIKLGQDDPDQIMRFEKWATIITGTLYFQFALVLVIISSLKLSRNEGPGNTLPGILIGGLCIVGMIGVLPFIKKQLHDQRSFTIQSVANSCLNGIKFSLTLLIASLLFYFIPKLWWVDSFAALFLAFQIGKEGRLLLMSSRRGDFERHSPSVTE